ncbi:MAG: glycerophosphodiester phosphodiesterase family protein [Verrucomicrobia bacterium]|nr:glycerophosphodiester phosphodiesterase family protein [Verrucomicrobiota bacterium]
MKIKGDLIPEAAAGEIIGELQALFARHNAPENTLAAFERANGLGVPWIELDVHPAKDGTLIVIHDDTVDRTTDGSGAVCEMSVDQLLRLDAGMKFSPAYTGEKIPRLCDVLEMLEDGTTRLNVEINPTSRTGGENQLFSALRGPQTRINTVG